MTLMANMGQYDENSAGQAQPLPDGDYPLALAEWESKPTKNGMGLKVVFVVLDGPYKDRKIYDFYNTQNPSADAVKISGAALKQFVISCGYDGNTDLTEQLMNACIGKPFVGKVKIKKAEPGSEYGDSNRVDKFVSNADYAAMPAAQQSPAQAPQQQAPAQHTHTQQAPVQQAPVQQAPVQQAPAQHTHTQQAPAQQGHTQQAPAQGGGMPWQQNAG